MNAPIDISQIQLTTPRLMLRPWKESDLQDLYAYASVDGVGQMAGWLPHKNLIIKCGFRYLKTTKYTTRYHTVENSMEYILYRKELSSC